MAKKYVKGTATISNAHYLGISNMSMTGSKNVPYGNMINGWPEPEFLFEDMLAGETVERWMDAIILNRDRDCLKR